MSGLSSECDLSRMSPRLLPRRGACRGHACLQRARSTGALKWSLLACPWISSNAAVNSSAYDSIRTMVAVISCDTYTQARAQSLIVRPIAWKCAAQPHGWQRAGGVRCLYQALAKRAFAQALVASPSRHLDGRSDGHSGAHPARTVRGSQLDSTGHPQADGAFLPGERALNKTRQNLAAIRAVFQSLFHQHHEPRIAGGNRPGRSAGNPVARTYCWTWTRQPFEMYRPASSSVACIR